jgi:cytochrome c oxidase subunit 3
VNVLALFAAVGLAILVWWLLIQRLTAKPWLESNGDTVAASGPPMGAPAKIGLWVFLTVITSLFTLFTIAYLVRMTLDDWRPVTEPPLLWANTIILLLSSLALHGAKFSFSKEQAGRARAMLLLAGLFTLVFLCGQWLAWQQLLAAGYGLSGNPASDFFYLLTGLHAVHLLGGLVVWGRTVLRLQIVGSHSVTEKLGLSIELCSVYWHYLLVVWLVLFGLLLIT